MDQPECSGEEMVCEEHDRPPLSPSPPRESPITKIFPEILAVIFSHLDTRDKCRAAQVCIAWWDVASHPIVWRAVEVELRIGTTLHTSLYSTLMCRGVRRIRASKGVDVGDLLCALPALESLDLRSYKTDQGERLSRSFIQPLPNLTTLKISWCDHITDEMVATITANARELKVLQLRGCTLLSDIALLYIANCLKRLTTLDMGGCNGISDTGITHLAEGRLALETLGCMNCTALTDDSLLSLSRGLPTLRSLDLGNCDNVRDAGMEHLIHMANLCDLNLFGCRGISDAGLAHLSRAATLRKLNLRYCFRITDTGLGRLAEVGASSSLVNLSLGLCRRVTDDGLRYLARLPNLRRLDLCQCFRITDAGLAYLAENTESRLTHLDIRGCGEVGMNALVPIANGLLRLRTLKVDERHVISQGMEQVAQRLHSLSVLGVGGINCIDEVRQIRAGAVALRRPHEGEVEHKELRIDRGETSRLVPMMWRGDLWHSHRRRHERIVDIYGRHQQRMQLALQEVP